MEIVGRHSKKLYSKDKNVRTESDRNKKTSNR